MKRRKTIYIDLDGTAAEWRAAASPADLKKKGYFATLRPTEIAAFANDLAKNPACEAFILSAYIPDTYAFDEKHEWSDRHMPHFDHEHRLMVPCGINKAAFVMEALRRPLTKDDVLIDDYSVNLIEWEAAGGTAIKWLNGINGNNHTFRGIRVQDIPKLQEILFATT